MNASDIPASSVWTDYLRVSHTLDFFLTGSEIHLQCTRSVAYRSRFPKQCRLPLVTAMQEMAKFIARACESKETHLQRADFYFDSSDGTGLLTADAGKGWAHVEINFDSASKRELAPDRSTLVDFAQTCASLMNEKTGCLMVPMPLPPVPMPPKS